VRIARPRWLYEDQLNRDSWQYDGLMYAFPLSQPAAGVFDAVSGTRIPNSGTITRGLDKFGRYLQGNASDGELRTSIPALSVPLSLVVIAYYPGNNVENKIYLSVGDGNGTDYISVRTRQNNTGVNLTVFGDATNNVGVSRAAGVYHLTGVIRDFSDIELYIDGLSIGTRTTSVTSFTLDSLTLFVSGDSTPFGYSNRRIYEARVYNRALSPTEIARLPGTWDELYKPMRRVWFVPSVATTILPQMISQGLYASSRL